MLIVDKSDGGIPSGVALPVYLIHYQAPDWVRRATTSLLSSDIPLTVCVINNSPDVALNGLDGRVTVIETKFNTGYAGGANVALSDWLCFSRSPFCLVGSHDLHVGRDALRLLVEAAEKHPQFGVLAPVLADGPEVDVASMDDGIERRDVNGTALLLRRECILDVGGFDEDFGSYAEDEEMCVRIRRSGWDVGRVPEARAHGLGSASARRNQLAYGNMLVLAYKTLGPHRVVLGIASHIKRAAVAAARRDWPEARDRLVGLGRGLRSLAVILAGRGPGVPRFDSEGQGTA